MIQRHKITWYFLCVFLISSLVTSTGAIGKTASINIISKNLSHRIVALDAIETRLKLIIGFTIAGDLPSGPEGTRANAALTSPLLSGWSLILANILEDDSNPPEGIERNDWYWILALRYGF